MSHPIQAGLAGCSSPAVVKFHPRQLLCVLSRTRWCGQALAHRGMAAVGPSSPFQPPMLLTRAVGGGRAGLPALQEQGSLHLRRAGEDRAVSTLRLQPTHRPARCKRTALALPLGQAGGHLRLLTQHSALKALAALLSSPAKVHRATCWSREGKRSRAGSPHRFFAPLV